MAELIVRFGKRLVISRRNKCVRGSFVFIITNLLAVAGLLFAAELVIIFLGLGNVFLPVGHDTLALLSKLFL